MHNSLQINENKTDFIIFSTTPHKLKKHTLQVGTNIIGLSKTVKILGVTFDDGMTLKQHICNTCRSSYMQLRKINSIRQYLTTNAVKTIVQSVVISRLDYCNRTYIGRPTTTTHKLQLSHNAAAVKLSRRLLDTAAATLWNDLPDNIRNCDNTSWTFKKLLKTYLF